MLVAAAYLQNMEPPAGRLDPGQDGLIPEQAVRPGYHPLRVGRDSSRIDGLGKTQPAYREKREHNV